MTNETAADLLYLADVLTARLMKTRHRYDPLVCDLRRAVERAYAEEAKERIGRMSDAQLDALIRSVREA